MVLRIALLIAVIGIAACSSGSGGTASPAPSASPATTVTAAPSVTATPSVTDTPAQPSTSGGPSVDPDLVPAAVLDPILGDAAVRAGGVDPSTLRIVTAEPAEWSDGSLGCPEPGMMYTQAIVNGWWVVIEHEGTQFDYRATGPGSYRICANQR